MRIGDFFRGYFSNRSSRNHEQAAVSRAQSALVFEELEGRILLSSTLFVDFGDSFNGTLNTTVGELDNTTSGTNPNIDGPVLTDSAGNNYAADTPVAIQSFNSVYGANNAAAAADRTAIMDLVQRFYAPLDVTVVQNSATSLNDISVALGANEGQTENNDSYVIVGLFTINGTDNPANFAANGYGGLATVTDIGNFNNNDGTAFVLMRDFANRYTPQFLGDQVAHESGHLFGLRHTFGNNPASPPPGSNIDAGLPQSDMMSYLAYDTFGGFDFFSRYPMVRGDGNTSNNVLSAFSAQTPFDQMRSDPNIGPSNMEYVTGTGQNDVITITKTGATQGTVSVQAFSDAAHTTAITVPGGGTSTTFTYTIDLTRPLLIDAGARDDRIVLDGDLGTIITLRGMAGNDELLVAGKNAPNGSYTPGTNTTNGLDGNSDRRGTLNIGSTTINFQEFEAASRVTVHDITNFRLITPLAADALTLDSITAGQDEVTGTSGAVTLVPMSLYNVTNLVIDTGANDGGAGSDTLTVASSGLVASGLQNLTFDAGAGDDSLFLNVTSYQLPVSGGAFTYLGGSGTNRVLATADVNFTLSDTSLGIPGAGAVTLSNVSRATLTAASGANSFVVSNWSGQATLRGGGGDDSYTVDFTGLGSGQVLVDDSSGAADTLKVTGTAGADTLIVDATSVSRASETVTYSGIDDLTVLGGAGEDDFIVNASSSGVTLDGQGDSDDYTVQFGALNGVVTVADTPPANVFDRLFVNGTAADDVLQITPTSVTRNSSETVNYSGIEFLQLDAGNGADQITVEGTSATTTVLGGDGDDQFVVNANGAFFTLTLDGQEGSDSYAIGLGSLDGPVVINDTGTTGIDTLLINGTPGDDVIILTDNGVSSGLQNVTFSGIEQFAVDAGAGNDLVDGSALTISVTIFGGTGDDTLIGGSNDDKLYGQDGNDHLHGGAGNDLLSGGDGADALFGDAGDDQLAGGAGDDHLYGGSGNDFLDGDAGTDIAYGGDGDDTLKADSRDDRLIDWLGNFNNFIVPGPGYGGLTIVRSPSPLLQDYLLNLASADGATDPNAEIVVVIPGGTLQRSNSGH
jgi:RTX calcium-binding nonapeptide repeat (4 copies)/Metallo-peptidase family M12B Reprolysin-like